VDELNAVMAEGKGAIFATSHSGNWELMGGAFACAGYPLVGVAKKQSSAGMDRFINEYRTLVGMHITYSSSVREMFRMLAEGWIIGLISDQDPSLRDGIIINFFGQETNAFTGAASIGRFRSVPIFPVFMHREPNGRHVLLVEPAIRAPKTEDKEADIRQTTQYINDRIEAWVRKYPEEWFWLHDRWKSIRERST
ncbi:MAG: lysophospholipid acyltransferase family protein, partial [Selenomonas artemidis]